MRDTAIDRRTLTVTTIPSAARVPFQAPLDGRPFRGERHGHIDLSRSTEVHKHKSLAFVRPSVERDDRRRGSRHV
jgi:hypothetical protein